MHRINSPSLAPALAAVHMKLRWRARACVRIVISLILASGLYLVWGHDLNAQEVLARTGQSGVSTLDTLIAEAIAASPRMRAAQAAVNAAAARVRPAGTPPDPMLMLGIQNLPLSSMRGQSEPMTMRMLGVSQTIPFPGKLPLMRASMRSVLDGARQEEETTRRGIVRDVSVAYFDIARADATLAILRRARALSTELSNASEAQYSSGTGSQSDAIRSRFPLARLVQETAAVLEERGAAVARLNALRNRDSGAQLATATIPERMTTAAVSDSAEHIRFVGLTAGSRATDSPFPSLERLQQLAIDNSASLRAHAAMIAVQESRTALSRKAHLPDVSISATYSQRTGFPDFISAQIGIPLALRRGSRQNEFLAAEQADLAQLEAEHDVRVNDLRATVAGLVAEAERVRTQLALYKRGILPLAKATLDLATANYRSGRGDITALFDAELMLLELDIEYHRALTDFARSVAELQFVTGTEVLS